MHLPNINIKIVGNASEATPRGNNTTIDNNINSNNRGDYQMNHGNPNRRIHPHTNLNNTNVNRQTNNHPNPIGIDIVHNLNSLEAVNMSSDNHDIERTQCNRQYFNNAEADNLQTTNLFFQNSNLHLGNDNVPLVSAGTAYDSQLSRTTSGNNIINDPMITPSIVPKYILPDRSGNNKIKPPIFNNDTPSQKYFNWSPLSGSFFDGQESKDLSFLSENEYHTNHQEFAESNNLLCLNDHNIPESQTSPQFVPTTINPNLSNGPNLYASGMQEKAPKQLISQNIPESRRKEQFFEVNFNRNVSIFKNQIDKAKQQYDQIRLSFGKNQEVFNNDRNTNSVHIPNSLPVNNNLLQTRSNRPYGTETVMNNYTGLSYSGIKQKRIAHIAELSDYVKLQQENKYSLPNDLVINETNSFENNQQPINIFGEAPPTIVESTQINTVERNNPILSNTCSPLMNNKFRKNLQMSRFEKYSLLKLKYSSSLNFTSVNGIKLNLKYDDDDSPQPNHSEMDIYGSMVRHFLIPNFHIELLKQMNMIPPPITYFMGKIESSCFSIRDLYFHIKDICNWIHFLPYGNDFKLNKTGRNMFPGIEFTPLNLQREVGYSFSLRFCPIKIHRKCGIARSVSIEEETPNCVIVNHPYGIVEGSYWMYHGISFQHIKLTDNESIKDDSNIVVLKSGEKYVVKLEIATYSPIGCFLVDSYSGSIHAMRFQTKTAYSTVEVTKLGRIPNKYANYERGPSDIRQIKKDDENIDCSKRCICCEGIAKSQMTQTLDLLNWNIDKRFHQYFNYVQSSDIYVFDYTNDNLLKEVLLAECNYKLHRCHVFHQWKLLDD